MNGMCFHLCQKYFNETETNNKVLEKLCTVNSDIVIGTLNKTFNQKWDYEILSESYILNDSYCNITVALYIPGFAKTGIATVAITGKNHLTFRQDAINKALANACYMFSVKEEPVTEFPATKRKFSDRQISQMKELKAKHNINTDEKLVTLLSQFNPSIKAKNQLTPDNIDDFFVWAKSFFAAVDDFDAIVKEVDQFEL